MEARIAERMTEHVSALAEQHGIRLQWVRSWRVAEALPGWAAVPTIRKPSDYLICLHELGHSLSKYPGWDEDDPEATVLAEGAAWAWAAKHAAPPLARHLRAADWNVVGYSFRTHVAGASLEP